MFITIFLLPVHITLLRDAGAQFPGRTRDYYCTQIVVSREEFAEKLKPLKYTNTQAHGRVIDAYCAGRFFQLLQNKRPHCATTTTFMGSLDAFALTDV